MAPETALASEGPILPSDARWQCTTCGTRDPLSKEHARHWWWDEARRHIRWAKSCPNEHCGGRAWHLGQAIQAREYARNLTVMLAGGPNRYAK